MFSMQQAQELPIDEDELLALAKFLDVLMEVDFELNSDKGIATSVS